MKDIATLFVQQFQFMSVYNTDTLMLFRYIHLTTMLLSSTKRLKLLLKSII